ncbi:transposase [Priestia aryabhattai]|uniref:transposase n=1 Tax=Priestia aryabhattai TaxID=412384 RepID=UPI00203CDBD5|nr:transposase [Priestia aryabhattai]MCM3774147.1 transposase [Priestia aryabhattai]
MVQREIAINIKRYKMLTEEICALEEGLEKPVLTLSGIAEILIVTGVEMVIVIELYSELGDIKKFDNAHQILKYAGLNLRESSPGKYKDKHELSNRGGLNCGLCFFELLCLLFDIIEPLKALHRYYTT